VSIEEKKQSLIARTIAQPFHHGDRLGDSEAHPTVFGRHGKSLDSEASAGLPSIVTEDLFAVAPDDIVNQLHTSKLDGGVLQFLLLFAKLENR